MWNVTGFSYNISLDTVNAPKNDGSLKIAREMLKKLNFGRVKNSFVRIRGTNAVIIVKYDFRDNKPGLTTNELGVSIGSNGNNIVIVNC